MRERSALIGVLLHAIGALRKHIVISPIMSVNTFPRLQVWLGAGRRGVGQGKREQLPDSAALHANRERYIVIIVCRCGRDLTCLRLLSPSPHPALGRPREQVCPSGALDLFALDLEGGPAHVFKNVITICRRVPMTLHHPAKDALTQHVGITCLTAYSQMCHVCVRAYTAHTCTMRGPLPLPLTPFWYRFLC